MMPSAAVISITEQQQGGKSNVFRGRKQKMQVFSQFVAKYFVLLYPNCTNTAATLSPSLLINTSYLVVQLRLSDEGDKMEHSDTNELQTLLMYRQQSRVLR